MKIISCINVINERTKNDDDDDDDGDDDNDDDDGDDDNDDDDEYHVNNKINIADSSIEFWKWTFKIACARKSKIFLLMLLNFQFFWRWIVIKLRNNWRSECTHDVSFAFWEAHYKGGSWKVVNH